MEGEHYSTGANGNQERTTATVVQLDTIETALPQHNAVVGTTGTKRNSDNSTSRKKRNVTETTYDCEIIITNVCTTS